MDPVSLSLLLSLGLLFASGDTAGVHIRVAPAVPQIERREGQALNFDFIIDNASTDTLELTKVEVTVTDRAGTLVLRRFLDNNGFAPSIFTIPERRWQPGQSRLVFNPFHTFAVGHDLFALSYEFRFSPGRGKPDVVRTIAVRPQPFRNRTDLILPVAGLLLIWDGHDFYSHHRRFDFLHPAAQQFGFTSNFMRYAYDFVRIDAGGAMQRMGTGNEAYYGFGEPVLAPAAGVIAAIAASLADNREGENHFDPGRLKDDPMHLYGNYVVIDHGNGEFSLLGHVRQGSVTVKVGDRVTQGQAVAQIGSSGSSYFPHLHYELRTGSTLMVEGLPSYFREFERVVGERASAGTDAIDTGDIVRSSFRVK
jgi:murein DD-endopeptidase MepM/ murein hydrolase activator NlpD